MNSTDILALLDAISATSSRNAKEDLLRAQINDPMVQEVVRLAYDPFTTFGITVGKMPVGLDHVFDDFGGEPWLMLDKLARRELTGHAARDAVNDMLASLEPASGELLRRIISKDLRCGISEKTINGVLPGTVPTFDLMLSKPFEEKRVKAYPVAVEPKLDGFRGMTLVNNGVAKAFSRVGNHFPQLDWAGPYIAEMVATAHRKAHDLVIAGSTGFQDFYDWLGGDDGPSAGIDAEAVSGTYKETSGNLRRKDEDALDTILNVFDAVPYAFMNDPAQIEWKVPYRIRREFAEFIVKCAPAGAPVVMTELDYAAGVEHVMEIYARHRANGLEGAMVKPLNGHYVRKKGHIWMKIKGEETQDLRITGWFEGKAGTKLEGKFGGFVVTRQHLGKPVEVRVGGGFSDAQREAFEIACRNDDDTVGSWIPGVDVGQAIGRLIEVEFHEITPDGSLRHPRFVRFRDDKDENLRVAA